MVINKNTLWSFKFEKIRKKSEKKNVDVNIKAQTTENNQGIHEYPNKPLQKEDIEESPFLVFQFKELMQKS